MSTDEEEKHLQNLPHDDVNNDGFYNHQNNPSVEEEVEENFDLMDIVVARSNNNQEGTSNRLTKEEEKILAYNKNHEASKKKKKEEEEESNSHDTGRKDGSRRRPPPRINTVGDKDNNILDSITKNQNQVEESEEFDVMHVVRARASGDLTAEKTKLNMDSMEYLPAAKMSMTDQEEGEELGVASPSSQEGKAPRCQKTAVVQQTPGAYAGAPGQDLQRNNTLRFSLVGAPQQMDGAADGAPETLGHGVLLNNEEENFNGLEDQHDGGQTLIPDTISNTTPQELGTTTAEGSKERRKMSRGTILFMIVGCIALVVGIVVAVVLTGGSGDGDDGDAALEGEDDSFLNPIETSAPSRPAGTDIEDYLWSLLPETTTQAIIQDVNGSQAVAIDWLLQDPSVEEYTNPRLLQRFSLATLYFEAGGAQWRSQGNWLSYDHHECNWMTAKACIDADKENGEYKMDAKIRFVKLFKANVHGNLPPQIGLLSDLEVFNLKENNVNGGIPSQVGLMTNLKQLSVEFNQLSGSIPDAIGSLTNMQRLHLNDNKLTGSLPASIGNLVGLSDLFLSKNTLSNSIPTTIGQLTKLKRMHLDENSFTGVIPAEVGKLVNVVNFLLASNRLVGPIPSELNQMSSNLRSLSLNRNGLSGRIPTFWATFSSLTELDLSYNKFSDGIPHELPPNVKALNFGYSGVSGTLPSELGLLTKLTDLKTFKNDGLSGGEITGPIPSELGLCTDLTTIELDLNRLSGTIPTQIGAMSGLEVLFLYLNNFLSGPIPSEIGKCTKLRNLGLDRNSLSGPLPTELANLQRLFELNITNNPGLTGTIPMTFCEEQKKITIESFQCGPVCGCNFCPCSA